jgi:hypothetical protein
MPRPTHALVAKRRNTEEPGRRIGVGWENDKGWIGIKLNPCVVISHNDDVWLNIYPIDPQHDEPPMPDGPPGGDEDDDIPF